jgi:hypothetical protein
MMTLLRLKGKEQKKEKDEKLLLLEAPSRKFFQPVISL